MLRKFGSYLRDQWMGALALFLVLSGGTAYAANTVLTGDIKDNEVYATDVRDDTLAFGGLLHQDLRPASVRSSEVADNSLSGVELVDSAITSSDLAGSSVGPDELAFGAVPSQVYTDQNATPANTNPGKELTVNCIFGDKVTGGGFVISGSVETNVPNVVVQRSYAVDADTWLVRANVASGTPNWQLTVIADCVS